MTNDFAQALEKHSAEDRARAEKDEARFDRIEAHLDRLDTATGNIQTGIDKIQESLAPITEAYNGVLFSRRILMGLAGFIISLAAVGGIIIASIKWLKS